MKQDKRNAATLTLQLRTRTRKLTNFVIANDVALIYRLAEKLERYALIDCNYGLTQRQRKNMDKVRSQVRFIVSRYARIRAIFNTDPRGHIVRLDFHDYRFENSMYDHTFHIY